ncbi:spherulation-specific family 4 protein [Streptomyces sp. NPDC050560]|uniref:spherulation-specific family 4 protein n=1 Tax=Streptomyces sp. NPDC050560 TaxID=3365630 RepID=UPI00379D9C2F
MPHVSAPACTDAGTTVHLGAAVPGLAAETALATWDAVCRPGVPLHWAALGTGSGPGRGPDAVRAAAAARVAGAGGLVLGRLDLAAGTRSFGALLSDAHRHLEWYGVDGFLLVRCPTDRAALPEVRRLTTTLRALRSGAHLVLGQGTHPHPGYVETADQLVTFAGAWSAYRWSQVEPWTADYPVRRFCHLVYGVPRGHLDEALRIARWQGAGSVFLTDHTVTRDSRSPWSRLPGYWDDFVSRIGTGVSE